MQDKINGHNLMSGKLFYSQEYECGDHWTLYNTVSVDHFPILIFWGKTQVCLAIEFSGVRYRHDFSSLVQVACGIAESN